MENEREKGLREELKRIQDSKPRGDSLLNLIRKLQRLQASGPPAQGVRSHSAESAEVVRLVAKYQTSLGVRSQGTVSSGQSQVLVHGGIQLEVAVESGTVRCAICRSCYAPIEMFGHQQRSGHEGVDQVFILVPKRP